MPTPKQSQTRTPPSAPGLPGNKIYETPVLVPLGELVKGSGNCGNGSYPQGGGGNCKAGTSATENNCISGAVPNNNCNQGGTR
ncbi:MAG TPA: hypothetical protein DDY20_12020 [Desulfobulbaceae bacterium]|nr:hypothetical protein [Desulfobulbaceae bacterium]